MTRAWSREYAYLRAFPGTTHDQYLDTEEIAVEWLLRMHAISEANKQKSKGAPPIQRGMDPDMAANFAPTIS